MIIWKYDYLISLVLSSESAAKSAKSLQLCPTLCNPIRRQPTRIPRPWDSPGKNTRAGCHFLLQCRKVKVKSLSRVQLLATPWMVAYQAPLSIGFSRQEYWSGVPLPSPSSESKMFLFLFFGCHLKMKEITLLIM